MTGVTEKREIGGCDCADCKAARAARNERSTPPEGYKEVIEALQRLFSIGTNHTEDRLAAQLFVTNKLFRRSELVVPFLEDATTVFKRGVWTSRSVGGPKWGEISETLLHYIQGKINKQLFIDRVFDLRHNNGVIFDKHVMVSEKTNDSALMEQLNHKLSHPSDPGRLLDELCALDKQVSAGVVKLVSDWRRRSS